ncbi:hypothetical protein [Humidesulfovibrio idahonensis]
MPGLNDMPEPGAGRSLWKGLLGPAQGAGPYEVYYRHGLGLASFCTVFVLETAVRWWLGQTGFHLYGSPLVHGGLAWLAGAVAVRKRTR